MGKFGTDTGLFWWTSLKYRTEYRLDLKINYGCDTIPHTGQTIMCDILRTFLRFFSTLDQQLIISPSSRS